LKLEDVEESSDRELGRHLLGATKYYIEHWKLSLAMVLANHHGCTIIYYEKIGDPTMEEAIYAVGKQAAFDGLYPQYWYLHDCLVEAHRKAAMLYNAVGDISWKDSFLEGAIEIIEKRLQPEDTEEPPTSKEKIVVKPAPVTVEEAPPTDPELPSTSLVKKEKERPGEQEEAENWAHENLKVTVEEEAPFSQVPYCEPVEEAYRLGKSVGWGLSLTRETLQKELTA
jgi:hypothetical protein